jgi:hypothetical protein
LNIQQGLHLFLGLEEVGLQGLRLKRFVPLLLLVGCFAWSSSMGGLRFIPIYEALVVKAPKNSPPHIAFEEVLFKSNEKNEWSAFDKKTAIQLGSAQALTPLYSKKIVLSEMVIQKTIQPVTSSYTQASSSTEPQQPEDYSWVDALPSKQVARLQEAQRRTEVLTQDWSVPTWSDMARETLAKSGALAESTLDSSSAGSTSGNGAVFVAGTDLATGASKTRVPQARVEVVDHSKPNPSSDNSSPIAKEENQSGYKPASSSLIDDDVETPSSGNKLIKGTIEITGGLAVTNEHHIEIRRSDEGVLKELGRVDLQTGNYFIDIEEMTGSILARLVDKDGKILGEGQFRLSRIPSQVGRTIDGFPLRVEPQPSFSGVLTSAYNARPMEVAPPKTVVTLVKGASELAVKKDGIVSMDQVTKGSTSIMRTAAPNHFQTAALVVAGEEFKTQLYPESMIKAFEDIVAQQRQMSFDGAPTVIWGRATLDEKPQAGVTVEVESDSSLEAVYFNAFMIPDPNLKATSDNGLYAFVAAQPGFHSLLAKKGETIFGYQNVVVEDNSVAQGDIAASKRSDALPIRVYDAFTGDSQPVSMTLQSLSDEVSIQKGKGTVTLPHVNRMGLMRVVPEGADYVSAQYSYNDRDQFIHVPLVRWTWLNSIKSYLKIEDMASVGTVVGFVPDENFEVYLAGYDKFDSRFIVYFDMQGRILQNRKGIAGGGFIIYNVPDDVHEVVVMGERTQKMSSRVIPVDPSSLSVLTFRE